MINKAILIDLSQVKNKFIYRVERGDTVYDIADKFHTTKELLISLNALTEEVRAGEFIVVEKIDGEEYVVKPTDSLQSIAHYSREKSFEIINKNKTDFIYVGQKIYI